MQAFFCFVSVVLWQFNAWTQSCAIEKGYAFQQASIPGKPPKKILHESGNQVDASARLNNNLLIFFETKPGCNVKIKRVWIKNKVYEVHQENVEKLPLTFHPSRPGAPLDTLVASTSNMVYQLHLQNEQLNISKNDLRRLPKGSIILEYEEATTTHYFIINTIKKLAPVVLQ